METNEENQGFGGPPPPPPPPFGGPPSPPGGLPPMFGGPKKTENLKLKQLKEDVSKLLKNENQNLDELLQRLSDFAKPVLEEYKNLDETRKVIESEVKLLKIQNDSKDQLISKKTKGQKTLEGFVKTSESLKTDSTEWKKALDSANSMLEDLKKEKLTIEEKIKTRESELASQKKLCSESAQLGSYIKAELSKVNKKIEQNKKEEVKEEKSEKKEGLSFSQDPREIAFREDSRFHRVEKTKPEDVVVYTEEEVFKLLSALLTKEEKEEADLDSYMLNLNTIFQELRVKIPPKEPKLTKEPRKEIAKILGYDIIEMHEKREKERQERERLAREERLRREKEEKEESKQESDESGERSSEEQRVNIGSSSPYERMPVEELIRQFNDIEEERKKVEDKERKVEEDKRKVEEREKKVEEDKKLVEEEKKKLEEDKKKGPPPGTPAPKRRLNY